MTRSNLVTPAGVLAEYLGLPTVPSPSTAHTGYLMVVDTIPAITLRLTGGYAVRTGRENLCVHDIELSVSKTAQRFSAELSLAGLCRETSYDDPTVRRTTPYTGTVSAEKAAVALVASLKFMNYIDLVTAIAVPPELLSALEMTRGRFYREVESLLAKLQRADRLTFEQGERVEWTDDEGRHRVGTVRTGDLAFSPAGSDGFEVIGVAVDPPYFSAGEVDSLYVPREKLSELPP